jgi:hypothetical protein
VRTDPTDTGGLFVGRRPGTAPTRYGAPPERGGRGRRVADALLAQLLLVVMVVLNLRFWGRSRPRRSGSPSRSGTGPTA